MVLLEFSMSPFDKGESLSPYVARSLDINGTPGFVIGNRLVPGAIDTQTMQQIVEAERAAAKTRK